MVDVETTLSSSATAGIVDLRYVHIETKSEMMRRRSNECADDALKWGVVGKDTTANAFAEMAELFAFIAAVLEGHEAIANAIQPLR